MNSACGLLIITLAISTCLSGCGRTPLDDAATRDAGAKDARLFSAEKADAAVDAMVADALVADGRGDRLSADENVGNRAGLAGVRIALFGNPNPGSESSLLTWLGQSTGRDLARIQTDVSSPTLTAATLSGYDILILERLVRSYSTAEATVLTSWVSGGGAVMSITGFYRSGPDTTNTNSLLSGIGIAYGTFIEGSLDTPILATALANHPVTVNISALPFFGGFSVAPSPNADSLGVDTTLATLESQTVCIAQVRGLGRVLVWGDEWIELDSEFAKPDVVRFWQQALTWLARR